MTERKVVVGSRRSGLREKKEWEGMRVHEKKQSRKEKIQKKERKESPPTSFFPEFRTGSYAPPTRVSMRVQKARTRFVRCSHKFSEVGVARDGENTSHAFFQAMCLIARTAHVHGTFAG